MFYFFIIATETWERLTLDGCTPQPRSESVALLIPDMLLQENNCVSKRSPKRLRSGGSVDRQNLRGSASRPSAVTSSNMSILKEITKLSNLNLTRLSQTSKCSYSALSSSESISETSLCGEMVKSQSANVIAKSLTSPTGITPTALPRDPISVPNFASLTSTLTPVEVTKLVYLDDEEAPTEGKQDFYSLHQQLQPKKKPFPKSASVRFGNPLTTPEEISETSDYASMETMNRVCSEKIRKDGPFSFANPNYMGPDIKDIISQRDYSLLNSPHDSIMEEPHGASFDKSEMIELKPIPPKSLPLSLNNSYNNQLSKKGRAYSASRAENDKTSFSIFLIGGKERGQVTVFKRPLSIWKLQLNASVF